MARLVREPTGFPHKSNVSLEEDAEPLYKTFEVIFESIPILIANFDYKN